MAAEHVVAVVVIFVVVVEEVVLAYAVPLAAAAVGHSLAPDYISSSF